MRIPCNAAISSEVLLLQFFFSPLGQSNSNSDTCAEFRIKYVGAIEKLKLSEGKSLEGPLDLINYIDVAQVKKKKFSFLRFPSELMALEKDSTLPGLLTASPEAALLSLLVVTERWGQRRYRAPWIPSRRGAQGHSPFLHTVLFTFSGAD